MVQVIQPLQDQRILQGDRTWKQLQWIRRGVDNAPAVKLFRQGVQPAVA
ncbi:hypothetical protein PGN35_014920 [Nodosilinea sp. PGN35]|nr:hypothetical protein [Nodosilinea sp. TSF1-S3]MDF0369934.1 hypothetical protein [Nodosilinea sp. TSF1-S3]